MEGNALMYDADGTSGGGPAVTIATGADIAQLDAAHVVIVDDAGHQV